MSLDVDKHPHRQPAYFLSPLSRIAAGYQRAIGTSLPCRMNGAASRQPSIISPAPCRADNNISIAPDHFRHAVVA
jgi:hypothetical protein